MGRFKVSTGSLTDRNRPFIFEKRGNELKLYCNHNERGLNQRSPSPDGSSRPDFPASDGVVTRKQARNTHRVLLVEDNRGDMMLVREALNLSRIDFHLEHIEDGEVAVRYLAQLQADPEKPRPSLILLDLNLPRRDGWEILSELRSIPEFADIPVVILSSSQARADLARARAYDRLLYLRKPPSFDEFLEIGGQIRSFLAAAV